MVEAVKAIDEEILALKKQLDQVKGKETEVYSRIVGYYRSVRNWNVGKTGEYRERIPFSTVTGREIAPLVKEEAAAETRRTEGEYHSYSYFYRTTCPNCPPMKEALGSLDISSRSFNVDSPEGMAEAAELNIFSAPTVVFFDKVERKSTEPAAPKRWRRISSAPLPPPRPS